MTAEEQRAVGGSLNQAIANAVGRSVRDFLGRGPSKAQAFYHHNVVVVVFRDSLTTAERNLVAGGRVAAVANMRQALQHTMRDELVGVIETLTGRRVDAYLSANDVEPDVAAEVFVLDRPVGDSEPPEPR
jgi:uncharacterized protein YbcI